MNILVCGHMRICLGHISGVECLPLTEYCPVALQKGCANLDVCEHTHSFPALPCLSPPYPSPLSGFIHPDSLMKGWFGGWRSPDYTQIYTCTYQRENTYNYIKTICFRIYTVYSDPKLTVSRHSSP